ncbi:MAG: DUF2267 domain-containing protein [Sandaracinaceae bacterium]|nr:MAG: DUF2267 domain-containing protein [Sandaracinaceae bacterium]
MNEDRLRARVREHVPVEGDDAVDAMIQVTCEALGACVGHAHRELLAAELPAAARDGFRDAHYDPDFGREALVAQVADSEHLADGHAAEHASAVLAAIAAELDEDERALLERELPEDLRPWVQRRSESRPPPRMPRSRDDDHADTKLSSSRGLTQERAAETLAEGRPGSEDAVSTAHGLTQEQRHETLAEGRPPGQR